MAKPGKENNIPVFAFSDFVSLRLPPSEKEKNGGFGSGNCFPFQNSVFYGSDCSSAFRRNDSNPFVG